MPLPVFWRLGAGPGFFSLSSQLLWCELYNMMNVQNENTNFDVRLQMLCTGIFLVFSRYCLFDGYSYYDYIIDIRL